MIAYLNLRYLTDDRAQWFRDGLTKLGYEVRPGLGLGDLLVTWNRIGQTDSVASQCQERGIPVIVVENRSWGDLVPGRWLHIASNYHNTQGMFPAGGNERWDQLGIELEPFRVPGETVVLAQRGIGSPPVACPKGWENQFSHRVRKHPGRGAASSLREDLAQCGKVITWGSAAAVEALAMGIPVESHMPRWIGAQDSTEAGRLAMFQRLAWAQWRPAEIASGEAMECFL